MDLKDKSKFIQTDKAYKNISSQLDEIDALIGKFGLA